MTSINVWHSLFAFSIQGRMAMVDVLCDMKERALKEVNPHIMTIATLTGHAVLANGPYTNVMDNGPAKRENFAQNLQATGDLYGDMFEISTVRREDFEFNKDKSGKFVDVLQANNVASSRTPRGHQLPSAFMQVVAGLDKHMCSSEKPLKGGKQSNTVPISTKETPNNFHTDIFTCTIDQSKESKRK